MIRSEPNGDIQRPLQIAFCSIHLQQLQKSFGTEFGIETTLKGIFGFFFML